MSLQRQKPLKLENLFAPRSPLEFLGYSIVTAIIGLISAGSPIGLIGVPVIAFCWWWIDRQRIKNQTPINLSLSLEKQAPAAASGLILLLSPYFPRNTALKKPENLQPLLDALLGTPVEQLKEADFHNIGLFESNLLPPIKAVEYHFLQGKLREVWLIVSQTVGSVQGSESAARILEKYLTFLYGSQLKIHCSEKLTILDHDYAGLYCLADNIFQTADYKDELIVADVTGGKKMMSVALAMACVPPKRRMQYMDSDRDWQGNPLPAGIISPVSIDVDPFLNNKPD